MPICPECREEYEPGVSRCHECGVALVDSTDDIEDPVDMTDVAVFQARGPGELAAMEEVLQRWKVPCKRPDETIRSKVGENALLVPASFSGRAMQILSGFVNPAQGGGHLGGVGGSGKEGGSEASGKHASCSLTGCGGEGGAAPGAGLLDRPVSELAAMGEAAVEGLIASILGGDIPVQKSAARKLTCLGEEGILAVLKLMKVTLEKEQMDTVNVLMATLREAEFRGSEWREFLPYLEHAKPVRIKTLEILGHLADRDAFPSVLPFLEDGDPEVRDEADNTLCILSDEDMGFEAESPAEERARIIARWKEWWRSASGGA